MQKRTMPDSIKSDWSNLQTTVEQFRQLGYSDSYILNTIVEVSKIRTAPEPEHRSSSPVNDAQRHFTTSIDNI